MLSSPNGLDSLAKNIKKTLAPEAAKGAGSRDDTNVEFFNGTGKKKSSVTTRCVTKQSPEVFSRS